MATQLRKTPNKNGFIQAHRALVTFGSGAPTDPWPDVAAAMQSAVRARAWGLARLAGAVGALVGSVDRVPLERAGSAPARAPFADRVTAAFRARHAFRSGRRDQASASLGIAEPIEPAIAPWIDAPIDYPLATAQADATVHLRCLQTD